jgi:hypothetical protein
LLDDLAVQLDLDICQNIWCPWHQVLICCTDHIYDSWLAWVFGLFQ